MIRAGNNKLLDEYCTRWLLAMLLGNDEHKTWLQEVLVMLHKTNIRFKKIN